MRSLWLADKFSKKRLGRATTEYLRELTERPVRTSRSAAARVLAEMRAVPGPKVNVGTTTWDEDVLVPLIEMVQACGLTTGGMGSGKTMFALLPIAAILERMPHARDMAFGVLDAKGELFERAMWLVARRAEQLRGPQQQEFLERIVIVDFANRTSISPYNILARWRHAEPNFFVTSRLETLRELLPSGEKLSLRGADVLKNILSLLSEFALPVTHIDRVLTSIEFRNKLVAASRNEEVKYYFAHHFCCEGKQTVAALRARMDSLFASDSVRLALAGSIAPDFLRFQNEGKIVLINCAGPTITRGVRLLLQGLVLADIRQSIFARPNNPPVTYLWCADEAQNFFLTRQQQENMVDFLTMARSFGTFFYFLCQNLSTAVPDARMWDLMHTNIRWSLTLRTTPSDAAFLKAALPVTGRLLRPDANPFREAAFYKPEEERAMLLNGIASLPDRVGYLWPKTRSAEAIRITIPRIDLGDREEFRAAIQELRDAPDLGGRYAYPEYEQLVRERDRRWFGNPAPERTLEHRMEAGYRQVQEALR